MSERLIEASFDSGEVVIGRHADVAIELPFAAVSGRHARLSRDERGFAVEDLGSTNGTWLAGRRLLPHKSESLAVGETIGIAGVEIVFEGERQEDLFDPALDSTATLARRLVHDIFYACPPAEIPRVVVLDGPERGRELVLAAHGRVFLLGRGANCDLALPDDDISREHAALERSVDGIVVRDLASKNGVEVGGERISGQCRLRDGEIIRIGETELRVSDPEDRYLRRMEEAVGEVEAGVASQGPRSPQRPSPMPWVAAIIATTVLLLVLGLVLALVFGALN